MSSGIGHGHAQSTLIMPSARLNPQRGSNLFTPLVQRLRSYSTAAISVSLPPSPWYFEKADLHVITTDLFGGLAYPLHDKGEFPIAALHCSVDTLLTNLSKWAAASPAI